MSNNIEASYTQEQKKNVYLESKLIINKVDKTPNKTGLRSVIDKTVTTERING
jgi:hypothetical protein